METFGIDSTSFVVYCGKPRALWSVPSDHYFSPDYDRIRQHRFAATTPSPESMAIANCRLTPIPNSGRWRCASGLLETSEIYFYTKRMPFTASHTLPLCKRCLEHHAWQREFVRCCKAQTKIPRVLLTIRYRFYTTNTERWRCYEVRKAAYACRNTIAIGLQDMAGTDGQRSVRMARANEFGQPQSQSSDLSLLERKAGKAKQSSLTLTELITPIWKVIFYAA